MSIKFEIFLIVCLFKLSSAQSPRKFSLNPALAIIVCVPLSMIPFELSSFLALRQESSLSVWSNSSELNLIRKLFFWLYVFSIILNVLSGLGLNSLLNSNFWDICFKSGIDLFALKLLKLIEMNFSQFLPPSGEIKWSLQPRLWPILTEGIDDPNLFDKDLRQFLKSFHAFIASSWWSNCGVYL